MRSETPILSLILCFYRRKYLSDKIVPFGLLLVLYIRTINHINLFIHYNSFLLDPTSSTSRLSQRQNLSYYPDPQGLFTVNSFRTSFTLSTDTSIDPLITRSVFLFIHALGVQSSGDPKELLIVSQGSPSTHLYHPSEDPLSPPVQDSFIPLDLIWSTR